MCLLYNILTCKTSDLIIKPNIFHQFPALFDPLNVRMWQTNMLRSRVRGVWSAHDMMSELLTVTCVSVLRPWTVAWCSSSATLPPSETPPWDATPLPTPSVWWRAAKGRYSMSCLALQAPVAGTSLWHHWFILQYESSINYHCLSFRTWSCPVLLRRSVISPLDIDQY